MAVTIPSTAPTLGFSTLEQEVVVDELELSGELPRWLTGSLLRTGPAQVRGRRAADAALVRRAGDAAPLHDRGRAGLLRQPLSGEPLLQAAREQGRIVYGEFATDPCRSLFKRVQTLFSTERLAAGQREHQRDQARRALHRDDRDATARSSSTRTRCRRPACAPTRSRDSSRPRTRTWTARAAGCSTTRPSSGRTSSYRFFGVAPAGRQRPA